MKKVLVTGAAGFIASHLCTELLKRGVEVIGIDNINDYYDTRLKHHRLEKLLKNQNFKFHQMDIEDLEALKKVFNDHSFDVVFNLAARAGVRASIENPFIYMSTNATGALNLMELIKGKDCKYVLASTSSLYAGQATPFLESLPVNTPISPYAASKKAAEAMAYSYHYLYGMDVSIVRYFTVYGPAGRPDMSIFRFIQQVDLDRTIHIYGDGAAARDFTYVGDIVEGTIRAAKKMGYEIINLGGGKHPITLHQVIQEIERSLNKKAQISLKDFHKADMKETWADISKAKALLDWEPQVSFQQGLQKTMDWYQENIDFARKVVI